MCGCKYDNITLSHLDRHVLAAQRHQGFNGWEVVLVLMSLYCSSHSILEKKPTTT